MLPVYLTVLCGLIIYYRIQPHMDTHNVIFYVCRQVSTSKAMLQSYSSTTLLPTLEKKQR